MANILQASTQYGPKLASNPMARLDQVADWMAMRTGLNKSEIIMVLQELNEAILFFNKQGTPVKLPGIGIFSPSIRRTGEFKINFRTDTNLKNSINATGAYSGTVLNKANIGIDSTSLKELWDADHPDDPLEV